MSCVCPSASLPAWQPVQLAVMGCVVNGPGESKAANIGISLPGTGEAPTCPVYVDGQKFATLKGTYEELSAHYGAAVIPARPRYADPISPRYKAPW